MKVIEKARMDRIAVAAVTLVSVARRLTGTRRLSSGITTLTLAGIMLLVAVGGASAEFACVANDGTAFFCGDTVTKSCTLNGTMLCSGSGLIVGASGITIEGYNASQDKYFGITGSDDVWSYGIHNYDASQHRGYHDVVIKNLEISGFQEGICIQGTSTGANAARVENNTIYNCTVYDCGGSTPANMDNTGYGIHFQQNIWNSTIDNCIVHDTHAPLTSGCESPGAGIRIFSKCGRNNVTNCEVYLNDLAGIYSKGGCSRTYVYNNNVYENGLASGNSFPGGIRMQCKNTNWWTVSNNEVWDNYGPGIFVGGQNCTIYNNEVTGSKNCTAVGDGSRGDGIIIDRSDTAVGGTYNTLTHNKVCENAGYDIYIQAGKVGNTGDENTCCTSSNYHDEGTITGCDYACIISCDASGNAKDEFAAGEKVYVKGGGYGISTGAIYNLRIQDDPVSDGDTLASDPSGGQETAMPGGTPPSFGPIEIRNTTTNPASSDEWDIVADKQSDGANTGKYNRASDGIDSSTIGTETMPGFVAPIPNGVCVWGDMDAGQFYVCGDTVTKSCTLNNTMTCNGDGLIIGSGQVRIYGDGYCIKGDGTGTGIYNPGSSTFFELHDLEIKNFETGIKLMHVTGTTIYDYLINNSDVHNNTIGIAIDDLDPRMCIIKKCKFHHNNKGIHIRGEGGTHIRITATKIYDNIVSGIHSEGVCTDCKIEYNVVSMNGMGIDLNASQWMLEHNLIKNNSESGITVTESDNILRYNTVGNNGDGIRIVEGSKDITLEANTFCNNRDRDVFVDFIGNVSGNGNACEIAENYNDTGTTGCTYSCTGCISESGIVYRCGGIVTESCTFNANIACPEGDGLIVWASGTDEAPLIIDGAEHAIDGIAPGDILRTGIYNPDAHDYVTIKNIEVAHFHNGINLGDSPWSPGIVEHNVIANCKVYDNGKPDAFYTHGIATYHAKNCNVTHCEIYNNTGTGCGSCEDGGRGLLLYGPGGHNNVTHNRIYGNGMVGIYSKMMSQHNYVAHNDVYGNGKYIPEGVGTYAPGGIALACKLTNHWIVEHNNVTNNIGSGIYIGGCYNIIRYNDIKNSKNAPAGEVGYGINGGRSDGSHDNEIYKNTVCENEDIDIHIWSSGAGNHGNENTCDTTHNYDDDSTTGCTYSCGTQTPAGDLNGDGVITPADAVIVLQMAVSGKYSEDADVSGDSMVTSLDALMITRWAAGL